jgi:cytochrome b involved in lipid metabolism
MKKNELIVNFLGVIFILVLTVFYGFQYKSKTNNLNKGITLNPSLSGITLSSSEIKKHNSSQDCWVIISGSVYDVTNYVNLHPGGASRISSYCGGDMTQSFINQPHSSLANQQHTMMFLGPLNGQINLQNIQNVQNNVNNGIFSGGREDD